MAFFTIVPWEYKKYKREGKRMDKILKEIKEERSYQDSKWGTEFDDRNTANDWTTYITQYASNAAFAKNLDEWRVQMLKTAALAVAALEAFDRNQGLLPKRHYDK